MAFPLPLDARVYVAGHRGLVGSAVVRRLEQEGFTNLLTPGRADVDLLRQDAVERFFTTEQPEYVFLVAGTVGGIMANSTRPADFVYDNVMIAANVIAAAHRFEVTRLLYLGSSCIYPKLAHQPMGEDQLLGGYLEPTNQPYAIAKIAGIELIESYRRQHGDDFISAMPTNLYGPGDNFHPTDSHVAAALMRRFHEAKLNGDTEVVVWGTGAPKREFLYVDDLADACLYLMGHYAGPGHINVGTGEEVSIRRLAELIRNIVAPETALVW
ncbi:MAG: GDP-L-fucose synthase, partial [Acidimicrobiia bacterium]